MDQYKRGLLEKLAKLQGDKERICEMDLRLKYQNLVSSADAATFEAVVAIIDMEMEKIKFDLILHDLLESDVPLSELLNRKE